MIKIRKGHELKLTIDKMAYGGSGVGRADGFVVFVRGTVPGDTVMARVYKKKKGYAEASLVDLLAPSPDRVEPVCPYSGYCGGCQWQHVRYENQLLYKEEQVREAIEHIAALKNTMIRDTIPSEHIFAYRNKMEFSFSDRRWYLPHELDKREIYGDFALGLHVPGTYNKVIDMETCLLQHETGNRILREVKSYAKESGIPVYGLKSHVGFWRYLTIRHSRAFDEWMVNIITSEDRPEIIKPLAQTLCRKINSIKTVVNNINRKKASVAVGEQETIFIGDGYIKDRIGDFAFQISANSFFQTNSLAAQRLYQKVAEYAELKGNEDVIDLYSGTGTIPIFLANRVRIVTGIELSSSATTDARKNCKENRIDNCRFICGDIREKLSTISYKPDVLIIDPPRAGMHKDVLAQVIALSPQRIVYISCNPATLARDIALMIDDYEPVEIQPVDMFPHTYHIEAVTKLELRKR